jgi:hypothetical protein
VFYQSADASQQYIQYKYGPEAGDAAKQSVPVAKDMLDGEQAGHELVGWCCWHAQSNVAAPCAAWAAVGRCQEVFHLCGSMCIASDQMMFASLQFLLPVVRHPSDPCCTDCLLLSPSLLFATATINFSRLGARAFVSKTAKTSAKVYFKSTMAGLHPDQQAAGQRLPVTTSAPAAAGSTSFSAAPVANAGPAVGAARGAQSFSGLPVTRSEGSSAYPPGSSAAAAAAGGGGRGAAMPPYPYPAK